MKKSDIIAGMIMFFSLIGLTSVSFYITNRSLDNTTKQIEEVDSRLFLLERRIRHEAWERFCSKIQTPTQFLERFNHTLSYYRVVSLKKDLSALRVKCDLSNVGTITLYEVVKSSRYRDGGDYVREQLTMPYNIENMSF
jgi:hypothetical protein